MPQHTSAPGPARPGRTVDADGAVHLGELAARVHEVLEGGLADDEVEGVSLEGHDGGVALLEVGCYPGILRVLGSDLDECVDDIQPGHLKPSESRELDRQVPGAERHLEHPGARREAAGEARGLRAVRLDLASRPADPGVPPRHDSFHLRTLEPPPGCCPDLHLGSFTKDPNGVRASRAPAYP